MYGQSSVRQLSTLRLTRRRALATGALSAATMVAWACGGSSSGSSSGGGKQGSNLYKPVDSSKTATKGGSFTSYQTGEPAGFDPLSGAQWVGNHTNATFVYNRLVKFKLGVGERAQGDIEGDLATSWEVSPDGLQYTFKLHPTAMWDSRAPTSSRAVDADDVVFSYNKFAKDATNRTDIAHIGNGGGPVLTASSTDKNTVVFKLANPDATVLALLANTDGLWILPREADGGFNPKIDSRGSSAWMLTEFTPSVGNTYRRNPNWFGKDSGLPFLDEFKVPIVPEYAQLQAQFRAGNVQDNATILQQDILQTKGDLPNYLMYDNGLPLSWVRIKFGWPKDGKGLNGIPNPSLDVRVRQAMSMALDRDVYLETFENLSKYEQAGFPKQVRWTSHISAAWEGYWIDPKDTKTFGPNAQYFQHNVADGKKLMAAAGFANGLPMTFTEWGNNFPTGYPQQAEVIATMCEDVGFKLTRHPVDYATSLIPVYSAASEFEGAVYGGQSSAVDPAVFLPFQYNSTGGRTVMIKGLDDYVESETAAVRQELDINKRKQRIQDFQRYMAGKMWVVPNPGVASTFALSPPWIGNAGYFQDWISGGGPQIGSWLHYWLDASKMKK